MVVIFFVSLHPMNIQEAIDLFRDYIATERRMAAGTVGNYIADLDDLRDYVAQMDVVDIADLTSRDIRGWQMEHMDRGEAPGTVKRRLSSVSSWLRYLRRRGIVEVDLMAKVSAPRGPKRMPVFYKESELEHLYDAGLCGDDIWGRRDALILRILYETGIRRSELVGLRETSVDLSGLTVKVLGKRNKERLVPIENELARNISDYLALKHQELEPTEWLFTGKRGGQLNPSQVYTIVRRYMTGLTTADRVSPHVFRHSFATHILDEGGDLMAIKELLGHADLATTEVYTHVTREHLKDVYRTAHPRGRKK